MSGGSFVPSFIDDLRVARAAVVYAQELHRGHGVNRTKLRLCYIRLRWALFCTTAGIARSW
jgi:hypothetical protein